MILVGNEEEKLGIHAERPSAAACAFDESLH
jgi:hypothetical protein